MKYDDEGFVLFYCLQETCLDNWTTSVIPIHRASVLRVGFFQKGTPELVLSERFGENQLVAAGGQPIIHEHIHPFPITPELGDKKIKRNKQILQMTDKKPIFTFLIFYNL